MTEQTIYVALLLAVGLSMGIVFDIYNTVTGAAKWFRWMRPLIDIGFWIVSACGVYYVVLAMDSGRLRFYTFVLLAMGYVLYRLTIHEMIVNSAFRIVRFVQAVFGVCRRLLSALIWRPIRAIFRIVGRCLTGLYQLACRVESMIIWVLQLLFFGIFWRWLAKFPGVTASFQWCCKSWEEFWSTASNWLRTVLVRS